MRMPREWWPEEQESKVVKEREWDDWTNVEDRKLMYPTTE